jgi:KDO2-lipid IV(A) lauroyltransferase
VIRWIDSSWLSCAVGIAVASVAVVGVLLGGGLWLQRAELRTMARPGTLLAWLVGSVVRVRRRHVVNAMRTAGVASPERVADAMYEQLGCGLFELLWVRSNPRRSLRELVRLDGELSVLGERSGGAVIATAHTGNWDLVACAAAERIPMTVATKRLEVAWLDRLWQTTRLARGVRLVHSGSIARGASVALSEGGAVAMLIDQAPERSRATVLEPFLGQLARVDLAPALLAMRARVPLVAAFPHRRVDGLHEAELACWIEPPPRPSRQWAEASMREVTRALDRFVRKHPEQWLWMHRRWKDAGAKVGGTAVAGHGEAAGCTPQHPCGASRGG